MSDDKRFIRRLKRQIKKSGNRKRRRFLKDMDADASGWEFGWDCSEVMNEQTEKTEQRRS